MRQVRVPPHDRAAKGCLHACSGRPFYCRDGTLSGKGMQVILSRSSILTPDIAISSFAALGRAACRQFDLNR